jgi:polyisoprenoid-binding protein YceI
LRRSGTPAALVAALWLTVAPSGRAAPERLVLDPARSEVRMRLEATLSDVEGEFTLVSGEIAFDRETGEAGGEVVVDARSGRTGIDARDRNMHQRVLESVLHPRVVLRPRRIAIQAIPGSGHRVRIEGTLELLGAEHEVVFGAFVTGSEQDTRIEARLDVPYVEWGLTDVSTAILHVAPDVTITVRASGRIEPVAPSRDTAPPAD